MIFVSSKLLLLVHLARTSRTAQGFRMSRAAQGLRDKFITDQDTMKAHDRSDDRFGARANLYSMTRPSYPLPLLQKFLSFLPNSAAARMRALDVAAGSGQLTVELAKHFDKVVALDKSGSQLAQAPIDIPNLSFRIGLATKLPMADFDDNNEELISQDEGYDGQQQQPLPSTSTYYDAITCAQAYHWFIGENIDCKFLEEVCRVLHPSHGILGLFGYGICTIVSSESLEKIFKKFYYEELGSNLPPTSPSCYWDMDRRLLDNCLNQFDTYGLMNVIERHVQIERKSMPVQTFLNYVRTFSGLINLRKKTALEGAIDPMEKLQNMFFKHRGEEENLEVDFPFFLIVMKPETAKK